MATQTSAQFGAEVNWPVVVGIGIIAVLVFYALYEVSGMLNQTLGPINSLEATIANIFGLLNPANWNNTNTQANS
jgi:hypothetical protein